MSTSRTQTVFRPAFGACGNGSESDTATFIAVADSELADEEWSDTRNTHTEQGKNIYDTVVRCGSYRCLEPRFRPEGQLGPMASGNIACVDGEYLPIHDRFETQEQYNILSR